MKSRLAPSAILGLITGIAGLGASLAPFGLFLEENTGLKLLFHLRGPREPPPEVLIVTVDKASSDRLDLPNDLRKWPRSLHARLTDVLANNGAAVIAFDIFFEDPRSPPEDARFAKSIRNARNTILCERLQVEKMSLKDRGGGDSADIGISKLVPPVPSLARSAAALAPFPLPKVPVKVSKTWTFKTGAGDTPTLPVVALQLFAMPVYGEFLRLMETANPRCTLPFPRDKSSTAAPGGAEKIVNAVRDVFENRPECAERMLAVLEDSRDLPEDRKQRRMLHSLIRMYQIGNYQYLNFYGPPRTIPTIRYDQALELGDESKGGSRPFDVRGKAVFVGSSEILQQEQKDGFHTVYTQPDGLDVSGVEIAATAFANFLEDRPLRPQNFRAHVATIFLWGLAIGFLCRMLNPAVAAAATSGLCLLYLMAARHQFASGLWYPVVVPLFLQAPLALTATMIWKYLDVKKERQIIRQAFAHYLPDDAVDHLAKKVADAKGGDQLVYGTCLATDAERYTTLSETLDPQELGRFMNRYYETVFAPVKRHRGAVSNVVGDSMLALWVSTNPETTQKNRACQAALEIATAIREDDGAVPDAKLPTRIGLHSGRILLGNVGAGDHFEYRPVGDIVNTTTRIEGLNKHLGTRILASDEVVGNTGDFLTREIGSFRFVGKSRPVVVHELLCRRKDADEQLVGICGTFADGLESFRRGSYDAAMEIFRETDRRAGGDGPSAFYLRLCVEYIQHPPEEPWDGVLRMDRK
ncbi:MAG TPA: adenylate/guanylate cyclase domain-containing protein [Candidatus Methylomirabilis sp.]|nr:adenylate/guanylate cyclase domain-containing protein [Candidatus Methylomirabilis sp.]